MLQAKHRRLQVAQDELVRLAGLLALVGSPSSRDDVFWTFTGLALQGIRCRQISTTVALIPTTPEAVDRIARCAKSYAKYTERDISREKFDLTRVVGVMLEVSDPDGYVQKCTKDGFRHLGAIFHPNTLENTAKTLRGSLGPLADSEATESILGRVETFED